MTQTPPDSSAQGYLLLTLDNVRVVQVFAGSESLLATGELVLECISLPIDPALGKQQANPFADASDPTKDLWLVVKVGTFELPLLPDHKIQKTTQPDGSTVYAIPSPHPRSGAGATAKVILPRAVSPEDTEDFETFEVLLKQYGCLPSSQVSRAIKGAAAIVAPSVPPRSAPAAGTSSPRTVQDQRGGRFVLVDEGTGQVIGELDNRIDVEVGHGVNAAPSASAAGGDGKMSEPVVVDFGVLDEGWAEKVTVQNIDEQDMNDWMLKSAHYISKGLLMFSSTASKSMTSAAELYIRNTKPRAEPVKFSPTTKEGIRQVHNVSTKGVKVTKKTLDTVNSAIGRVVEKAADKGYGSYDKAQTIWNNNSPGSSRRASEGGAAPYGQPPPYAEKPAHLQVDTKTPASQGPGRTASPGTQPSSAGQSQRPFWNRVFLAADVIGSSIEAAGQTLITSGTNAAAEAAGHKYGAEAGEATRILGGSVRNVALVYVDVRGVGRKTLFKSTAKGFKGVVKTRLADGKEVTITGQDENGNLKIADGDHAAQDVTVGIQGVGMQEAPVVPPAGGQIADPKKMKKVS
ncbi:hypothetical protein NliqN6_4653 [Naganishia liquefaciens]|uniref:Senescence domain-containing protein n=1 Tax=Naganishia liquefaciens TaxID=104408 RepID=A0A8H3TWM4_9TREE|nr:hypothetical protein NliqN6_4653 [Naganishia liquefaciens]